ncbi:MAG: DUF4124 domain-containing protein [Pseudomonadota bacterium]
MLKLMAAMAACALAHSAQAAADANTIYKCTVNGRVSYGDQPCAAGTTAELAVRPAPPPDKAAAEKLASDRLRLAEFEKDRAALAMREERERQRAAKAAGTLRQKCERLRLKQKWLEEDLRALRGEALANARLKAQRQAQALAVECPA